MNNVQHDGPPVNGSASKANERSAERPAWLAELRAEIRALREEVRTLRGKQDEGRNLDVDEAAEIANISRRTLDTLIAEGEVPSLKIGRRRLIPNRSFRAWLRRRAEEGQR